jgi:alkylation response protein AidB-like acyl-CoA dehydrogenase
MELELNKEQLRLKSSARDYLKKECPISLMREMKDDSNGFPQKTWQQMADLGWLGIVTPETYGGTGGSFVDLAIILEALGEVCCPGPFFSSVVLAGQTILALGSETQKQDLLPRLVDGKLLLSLALNEPGVWCHPKETRTAAIKDGNDYLISGTKLFVESAHIADYLLCVVKDGSAADGLSVLLVDSKSDGIETTLLDTLAYEKQCEVIFNNVRVPAENILGGAGQAGPFLETLQTQAVVAKCAELLGVIQAAFDRSVTYAKDRKQFGKAIGSFQSLQHHCANMVIDVDGARFLTYAAAWKIAENQPVEMDAAMAKSWTSTSARKVTALAHQIHGAISFCDEHDLHLYYRKAKAGEVAFGDSNHHLDNIARQLGL